MVDQVEQSLGAISGSREPDPSSTGSGPAGFDPGREAAALDELDRRYLIAVPRQIPLEAHWIASRAGDPDGSRRFSGFARRNAWMLQRMPSESGPSWVYRLNEDGARIADAIIARTSPSGLRE